MTENIEADILSELIRRDFGAFLRMAFETVSGGEQLMTNWHHDAIGHRLDRVRRGETTRLMICMPPRNLKSITISVAWVAWMLGHDPGLNFVCVSYSSDLARKHAADCRAVLESDWYRRAFPGTRFRRGGASEMDFRTTKGGGRLSTSVGGTLTGRGGDIIVIDDPMKPEEAMSEVRREAVKTWYANKLSSRLNNPKTGTVVLVMQRLHEDDLAGHLLEGGGWDLLSLPAIAEEEEWVELPRGRYEIRMVGEPLHPEREPLERLQAQRIQLGSLHFAAQYQQSPVPAEGNLVKREWLRRYGQEPVKQAGDLIVQSWDTATKDGFANDYSVCVTALKRKGEIHILRVDRGRWDFPTLKRKVIENARADEIDTLLIEDAASGQQLIQQLRHEEPTAVPKPIAIKPHGDKLTRFDAQTARIENGDLVLPEDAPWLAGFEKELLGFPHTKHDDQADATAQLLAWAGKRAGLGVATFVEVVELDWP
ncbi:MAG: phage terminase large subunit [Pseudomonadota bacterium]